MKIGSNYGANFMCVTQIIQNIFWGLRNRSRTSIDNTRCIEPRVLIDKSPRTFIAFGAFAREFEFKSQFPSERV